MTRKPTALLDRRSIERILGTLDPVEAVENILREKFHKRVHLPGESTLYWLTADQRTARSIGMPGALPAWSAYGMKVINSSLANTAKGLPRASGVLLLFDPETAEIRAVMESARISALRTALVSLVGAQRLATLQPLQLGLVGCGPIGLAHLEIFASNLSVDQLILYDPDSNRVAEAITQMTGLGYLGKMQAASSVQELFEEANCIIMATTTTEPYVGREMVRAGQTLINVSLDDVDEDVFYMADQVWVDDLDLIIDDKRRLLGKLLRAEQAQTTNRRLNIRGNIDQLVATGNRGRLDETEIIVFNPFGMSILDVGIASLVFRASLTLGYGDYFDFEGGRAHFVRTRFL